MSKLKNTEKEIFDTVYQWGRVGIVTDHECETFQSLMTDHANAIKEKEIILTPEIAQQISKILAGNKEAKNIKEIIDDQILKL